MYERLFGEILVEMGLLTDEQVKQVLEVQKNTKQNFGQITIRLGLATAEQVWEAWARQMCYRRRFVEPMEIGIDTTAVVRVTIPTARALGVVPLRLWGDNLVVAGAPDLDPGAVSTLADRTCCRVYACMAYPESIQYYLDRLEQFVQPGELTETPAMICG